MAPLLEVLKSRWFLTLVGVVLLCLLIWFAGPYFAFADVRPWASPVARLVSIIIVVAVWATMWQWRQWRAARASAQLASASAAPTAAERASRDAASGADTQLRSKFEEAVAALRRTRKGATNLLDLPWYIIIGPPGAGKTTALANSGLEFPLAEQFGRNAVRGVGGTRSCDWWFTTDAILLDTAGRYTTQDSDAAADRAGWIEFLALLKRHRRRRPINGVLLAMSIAELASLGGVERDAHVQAIRRRLEELHRHLGVRLPVYVLLTKADLIAGFNEHFDDLDHRGRSQVWGVTFPLDESYSGQAQARLAQEFDQLVARLSARVPARLQAERDASRRSALFGFPQQMASLKGPITSFVRATFSDSLGDDRVWLRGVYLTSGTQEGTPIDRMMGALARTFGLGVQAGAPAPGQGKAYFIAQLLREVVFREAGLADADRRTELRRAALHVAFYVLVAALTVGGVAGMVASYRANAAYLGEVAHAAKPLADVVSRGREATLDQAIPPLDALRLVVDAAARYRDDVPLRMRFGLFQGRSMSVAAEDAYLREMNASLGPAAARHFADVVASSGSEPDRLFEILKAYMMLGDPKRLDTAQMKQISHAEWSRALASDPETADRLSQHFDTFSGRPDRVQPVPLDRPLVESAQVSLQQASLPLLMYSRVRLAYAGDSARALQLDKELGLGARSVLTRKSGKTFAEPFPALYTRAVFDEFNTSGKAQLVSRFLEDAWVLGPRAPALSQSPRLAGEVIALYEQDYVRAWDALLADVTVRSPRDSADAADILAVLASPTSPLKRLLVLTEANTNLLRPGTTGDPMAAGAAKLGQVAGQLDKVLGSSQASRPGALVTQHFAAIHELVTGPSGSAPVDRLLAAMGQVQQQLRATTGLGGQPGDPAALATLQNALRGLQLDAAQLPPAVGSLIAGLSGQSRSVAMGVARSELFNRYQTQVVAQCRELIDGRYPFNPASPADVTLEDFGRVFGSGGLYDAFFQANLAAFVDTSRATWRWRDGADAIGGSARMLTQFQAADRVRQLFFKPGAALPEFRFNAAPDELDASVERFRLEIDGQVLEYRHGPRRAVSMAWPGGSVGQAVASFEQTGGLRPQLAYTGPWALFRLLDQATVVRHSETRFHVTFRASGQQARVVIEAGSIRNPLARPDVMRFRCG